MGNFSLESELKKAEARLANLKNVDGKWIIYTIKVDNMDQHGKDLIEVFVKAKNAVIIEEIHS